MTIRVVAAATAFCVGAGCCSAAVLAASAADAGLEEIIVTAQRREESVQDIGIAISVLSGDSLAEKSITRINDVQNATPSLQVEPAFGSGQPQFRLRGIGFSTAAVIYIGTVGAEIAQYTILVRVHQRIGNATVATAAIYRRTGGG